MVTILCKCVAYYESGKCIKSILRWDLMQVHKTSETNGTALPINL